MSPLALPPKEGKQERKRKERKQGKRNETTGELCRLGHDEALLGGKAGMHARECPSD